MVVSKRHQNVLLVRWSGNGTLRDLARLREEAGHICAAHPHHLVAAIHIEATRGEHLAEEVRRAGAALREELSPHLVAELYAVEAIGFLGMTARLTLQAVNLLWPPQHRTAVYPSWRETLRQAEAAAGLPVGTLGAALVPAEGLRVF